MDGWMDGWGDWILGLGEEGAFSGRRAGGNGSRTYMHRIMSILETWLCLYNRPSHFFPWLCLSDEHSSPFLHSNSSIFLLARSVCHFALFLFPFSAFWVFRAIAMAGLQFGIRPLFLRRDSIRGGGEKRLGALHVYVGSSFL